MTSQHGEYAFHAGKARLHARTRTPTHQANVSSSSIYSALLISSFSAAQRQLRYANDKTHFQESLARERQQTQFKIFEATSQFVLTTVPPDICWHVTHNQAVRWQNKPTDSSTRREQASVRCTTAVDFAAGNKLAIHERQRLPDGTRRLRDKRGPESLVQNHTSVAGLRYFRAQFKNKFGVPTQA